MSKKSGPQTSRNWVASWGEHTAPFRPASFASSAKFRIYSGSSIATRRSNAKSRAPNSSVRLLPEVWAIRNARNSFGGLGEGLFACSGVQGKKFDAILARAAAGPSDGVGNIVEFEI